MLLFFSELAAETLLRLLSEEGLCDAQSRGPTILQKSPDECIVTIEANEVARCNSLEDSFLALASSVYIFNQAVPKKSEGSCGSWPASLWASRPRRNPQLRL